MTAKFPDYNLWPLEELRSEATKRAIPFVSKDGVKRLAGKQKLAIRDAERQQNSSRKLKLIKEREM